MKYSCKSICLSFLGLLLVAGLHLASTTVTASPNAENNQTVPSSETQKMEEKNISQFVDTITTIKNHYAKTVDDKKLLEDAIRGMVSNLDPHSEYLDESDYKALLETTNGEFGGLGIEISAEYGVLKVISPVVDTPASKAGIKAGDYIVAVNDSLVNEITPNKAIDIMRGKAGTSIILTIIRPGEKNPLKFTLTRDIIHMESVKSKMLENNYGYVRITQFQDPSTQLLIKAINQLKKEAGGHLKGLILDLRNNPGGLLETAVSVSDIFLNSATLNQYDKKIVFTDGRGPESQFQAIATGQDILEGAPLVILINDGSASASEIVAGALQDYRRALIVGTTSFGKGSVQTIIPLDKTHAIKITTALYHTPSGRIIQNHGITPDVFVPEMAVSDKKNPVFADPIREFQLKDALKNQTLTKNIVPDTDEIKSTNGLAQEDFQLYEALNMLKAMHETNLKP